MRQSRGSAILYTVEALYYHTIHGIRKWCLVLAFFELLEFGVETMENNIQSLAYIDNFDIPLFALSLRFIS